ncbi:MAG: hypothetical protein ACFB0B_17735 [Thermonemataceae bacterium]
MTQLQKILLIGTSILLLILSIVGFFANTISKRYIEKKIKQVAQQRTLDITYTTLSVDVWKGNLTIEEVSLRDTQQNLITLPRLSLEDISIQALLFSRHLQAEKLHLKRPSLQLSMPYSKNTFSSSKKDEASFEITLQEVSIDSGSIQINRVQQPLLRGNFMLQLQALTVLSSADTTSFDLASYHLQADNLQYFMEDYDFLAPRLQLLSTPNVLTIEDLQVVPKHSRYRLGAKYGHQVTWFKVSQGKVTLRALDWKALLQRKIQMDAAEVQGAVLEIFRDLRLPSPSKPPTPLPQQMLNELPFSLAIDTVLLAVDRLTYQEHVPEASEAGVVFFTNLRAEAFHVVNQQLSKKRTYNHLKATAQLYGQGYLQAFFNMPLAGDVYTAKGAMGNFDLPAINAMATPSENLRIESGRLERLDFQFTYNRTNAWGEVALQYDNLKVQSLTPQAQQPAKVDIFKTLFMNIGLHKDSSQGDQKKSKGKIQFQRNPQKSVFHYWWKSLLSGIKEAVKVKIEL